MFDFSDISTSDVVIWLTTQEKGTAEPGETIYIEFKKELEKELIDNFTALEDQDFRVRTGFINNQIELNPPLRMDIIQVAERIARTLEDKGYSVLRQVARIGEYGKKATQSFIIL